MLHESYGDKLILQRKSIRSSRLIIKWSKKLTDKAQDQAGSANRGSKAPFGGCALMLVIIVVCSGLLIGLGALVFEGEVRFGDPGLPQSRLWLIGESDNRGLGFTLVRQVSRSSDGEEICIQSRSDFLLWKGDSSAQPNGLCDCYRMVADRWRETGSCQP